MEWVSTTAKSVPEAIDLALDNLGVDQDEAEIVVVEEPKQGLFGRVRGSARVKARVKPLETSSNDSNSGRRRRNDKRRGSGSSNKNGRNRNKSSSNRGQGSKSGESKRSGSGSNQRSQRNQGKSRPSRSKRTERDVPESSQEEVSEHLTGFLSGLSTAFGFDGEVNVTEVEANSVMATIEGQHGLLVGPKGRTLDAIQELSRMSAQRTVPSSVRIAVDVGGYRVRRNEALGAFALKAADRAATEGTDVELEPMNSSDRKVIHNALMEVDGIETRSVGNDPRRRVVVAPGAVAEDTDESE